MFCVQVTVKSGLRGKNNSPREFIAKHAGERYSLAWQLTLMLTLEAMRELTASEGRRRRSSRRQSIPSLAMRRNAMSACSMSQPYHDHAPHPFRPAPPSRRAMSTP